MVQLVDLLGILAVSISEVTKFILEVLLLRIQLGVQVLMLGQISLQSGDLGMTGV